MRIPASDELLIEADGPGVTSATVATPEFLAFTAAYLQLLTKIAEENGEAVGLTGVEVLPGSVALASRSSAPAVIPFLLRDADSLLSGMAEVPVGLRRHTNAVRQARAHLPSHYTTNAVRSERGMAIRLAILSPQLHQAREVTHEIVQLRVKPIRAGGATAVARFEAIGERRPFTLSAKDWDIVRQVGAVLQQSADIVAQVVRNEEGDIECGTLLAFDPVPSEDSAAAWREWYRSNPDAFDLSDLQ